MSYSLRSLIRTKLHSNNKKEKKRIIDKQTDNQDSKESFASNKKSNFTWKGWTQTRIKSYINSEAIKIKKTAGRTKIWCYWSLDFSQKFSNKNLYTDNVSYRVNSQYFLNKSLTYTRILNFISFKWRTNRQGELKSSFAV